MMSAVYRLSVVLIIVIYFTRQGEAIRYHVTTHTSNDWYSGTDANVHIEFRGRYGNSGWYRIGGSHERGDTNHNDVYTRDVGPIFSIGVKRDNSGMNSNWRTTGFEVRKGSESYRFPCHCWIDNNNINAEYSCNSKGTGSYACNYHGTCEPYGRCSCDSYYYLKYGTCIRCPQLDHCSKQKPCTSASDMQCITCDEGYYLAARRCKKCHSIPHCQKEICSTAADVTCELCDDQKSDISYSLYWPTDKKRTCSATCSWNKRWCWPGNCSDHLSTSCKCRKGFKKVEGQGVTKCDLSALADLMTCSISIENQQGQIVRSTPGNITGCEHESSTYSKQQPNKMLNFHILATFVNKTDLNGSFPIYIDSNETNTGIVSGKARVYVELLNGKHRQLKEITLHGGGDCSGVISNTRPNSTVDCHVSLNMSQTLQNGERLCTGFEIFSGGYFSFLDFGKNTTVTETFTPQPKRKTLCLNYDNVKPEHCSSTQTSPCNKLPISIDKRITKTGKVLVLIGDGWEDPWPQDGLPKHASGIKQFTLELHDVKHKGNVLEVDKGSLNPQIKEEISISMSRNISFILPKAPALYSTMLEVHDNAGNVRFARRFVLFDNESTVEINDRKPLRVVSASTTTHYTWQVNHGLICLNWKDRYYNNYYIHNNLLAIIEPDTANGITGVYDQQTGKLPVNGTKSINGLTDFIYSYSLNNGPYTPEISVSDFQNQLLCLNRTLSDGDTYTFWITAEDVMENRLSENVTVYIDRTVPDITNTWLVRNRNDELYVHNSLDLSHMTLEFEATDQHSGIHTMQWYLGTQHNTSDIGHGALPVIKRPVDTKCVEDQRCYCPAVGACSYFNYTVTLNSLVNTNTNIGKHNREYYFTLIATNGAMLKSVYHLDILVDASPPVAGVVREGSSDGPDIDYTSEDSVTINMHGFIDHESGIRFYLVALAERCLTFEELNNLKHTKSSSVRVTINPIIKLTFPNNGLFFSSVVAFNNAMEPSRVVCSDGITKDTTPPLTANIRLRDGQMQRGLWCKDDKAWYVDRNMTLIEIQQMYTCQKKCKHQESVGYIDALPLNENAVTDNDTSENLCSSLSILSNKTIMYLPSDKIYLKWENNESESQIRDYLIGIGDDRSQADAPSLMSYESTHGKETFQLPHSGFTGGSLFYIFLKSINKAGLTSVVILGPIMIDETPPQMIEKLYPRITKNKLMITWTRQSIKDPEEHGNKYTVFYRVGAGSEYLTPILQTPKSALHKCQMEGFAGCVQYPLKALQEHDSEQSLPFFFELHIYNTAGHFTLVKTETIRLPSRFPPGNATVFDINPYHQETLVDVDFHNASKQACVYWTGFYHHHNVTFYVGVGQQPRRDDILTFVKVEQNPFCFISSALKPNKQYFTSVKAICSGGTTVSSSDGFIIVDESNLECNVAVYDGIGCINDTMLTSNIYTLVKDCHLRGFTIKHLVVGIEHTFFITNALLNLATTTISSHNAIIVQNDVANAISFIPTVSDVELLLHKPVSASSASYGYVTQCINDIEFQHSSFQYSMHWHTHGLLEEYITHFIISLEHKICNNTSDDCIVEIASHTIQAIERNYTWNKLSLPLKSLITANVQPCFEDICVKTKSSNGLFIVHTPRIVSIDAEFRVTYTNCTNVSVFMDAVCDVSDVSRTFQWYLAKQRNGHQQLTPMNIIHEQQPLGLVTQEACVPISVHSYQELFLCAKVFCTSFFSEILCKPVALAQDISNYKTSIIYDIDMSDANFERASNLVKSQHLDKDGMTFLHKNDVNFATSDTIIGGVLTNMASRNVTWYLMTKKSLPRVCSSDESCVSSLQTVGGVVNFKKIYLQNRQLYHICASLPESLVDREFFKEKLDSFAGCSNGFVVDDDPPEPGSVTIIGQNNGFITERTSIYVAWSVFPDVEKYVEIQSGIAGYSFALGTIPNSEDVVPFRSVGMTTTGHLWNLTLTNGQIYYATVKASDHMGHTTTAVSEGVLVDTTPPSPGTFNIVEGLLFHQHVLPRRDFRIQWRGFDDPESGISTVRLAVGSLNHKYDRVTVKKYTENFADIKGDGFVDGHQYRIRFEVTNRAGLSTIQHTTPFLVDASPPDIGIVKDGHASEKNDVDYQMNTTTYHCHWSGFTDAHSGIVGYNVGLGSNRLETDVQPLVSVGLRTNFSWVMPFIPGKRYFVIVKACNKADLCSMTSSDGLTMDNTPPLIGRVLAGHKQNHQNYIGHLSSISGHFQGFEDPETGIVQFEWCLGYEPYKCNITSFESIQLADSFIKSGLRLPPSVTLYLTVRATNHVGLQSVSTSDGFIVDNTVPTVIEQPHFVSPDFFNKRNVSVQTDISLIHVSWKFEDRESPIVKHILTLKTYHESNISLERKEIGAETSYILTFNKDNRLRNGDVYSLSVTACNQAGLCATAHSNDLLIDSTPPQLGGFKIPLTWEHVQNGNRTLTLVNLTWFGFSDIESNIAEYQLMVSRSYDGFELSEGIKHLIPTDNTEEQSASVLLSEKLRNHEFIILSISAKNTVGLITSLSKVTVGVVAIEHGGHKGHLLIQRHSCDVHYCTNDCTCAIVGRMCDTVQKVESCINVQNETNLNKYPDIKFISHLRAGEKRHYQSSTSCLSAEWGPSKPNSLQNITRFEWSMGLRGQQVGSAIFNQNSDKIWHSTGKQLNVTYCLPSNKSLHDGEEYVVYVRVWYSFTEFKQFESSPVLVDSTAPSIRRGKQVKDSDETCKNDFDFVTRSSLITSCWGGVFQDSQSGIYSYVIQMGSSPYGSDVIKPLDVGTKTNYSISQHLLIAGRKYFVMVKAVNKAGLYTIAFSDGFVVDDDVPLPGVVFNTAERVNQVAQSSLTSFAVSWRGFQDHHSAVVNYKVAIYKVADVPKKLIQVDVGFKNNLVFSKLHFVQGERYQASVTAVDAAGLVSSTVMSPPVLIDSTPPIGFECSAFSAITMNITWNSNLTSSNNLKATIGVQQNAFYKIRVTKLLQTEHFFSERNIYFKVGEAFVPTKYTIINNATRMEAYHYFLAPQTGNLDIEIMYEEAEILSPTDISVFSCDKIQYVDGPRALTVQQVMPSLVSICARVFDSESDLIQIKIGVGTTKGGFQIRPLKPTFLHFHELVETNVPHGTPVFVTVTVENSARLVSVFKSDSLIIDHTPPFISKAEASLVYSSGGTHNVSVMADVTWSVHDDESGVKSCWCALGHKPFSEHVQLWTLATQVTRCSLQIAGAFHFEEIYASVKCFNQIDLYSSTSVGPRVVLLQPPSSREGRVVFLVTNEAQDVITDPKVQADSKRIQMAWFGLGNYYNTETFFYHITAGGEPVTDWMNTSYTYAEVNLDLHDGVTYTAEVIAVDIQQQKSDAIACSLVVDSRPPILTGSTIYAKWQGNTVLLEWGNVFHHPRSALVYSIAVGSRVGYTDLFRDIDTVVPSVVVDVAHSVKSLGVVIKATADNGKCVTYTEYVHV